MTDKRSSERAPQQSSEHEGDTIPAKPHSSSPTAILPLAASNVPTITALRPVVIQRAAVAARVSADDVETQVASEREPRMDTSVVLLIVAVVVAVLLGIALLLR
jgi:hypothetical protein